MHAPGRPKRPSRITQCAVRSAPSSPVSQWPSVKARRLLAALLAIGWRVKRQTGSHRTLAREGWPDVVYAFHDNEEIGPRMLARLAKHTGITPGDL